MRGLRTKTTQVFSATSDNEYDVLAFTETWLNANIYSSEIFSNNMLVFRSDRNYIDTAKTRGGGVLLAISNTFNSVLLDTSTLVQDTPYIDVVGCKISFNNVRYHVFCVYIPPKTTVNGYEIFFDNFSQLCFQLENLIIVGDFNCSNFETAASNTLYSFYSNFTSFANLQQLNKVRNAHNVVLDLVLSNIPNCDVYRDLNPIVQEDLYHPALGISISFRKDHVINFPSSSCSKTYNFRKANFNTLYSLLSDCNWSCLNEFTDVNLACKAFYEKLYTVFDVCVPKFSGQKHKFPSWYTPELRRNIALKNSYRRKFKKYRRFCDHSEFVKIRRLVKSQISRDFEKYTTDISNRLCKEPQYFWQYVRSKKSQTRIPGILTHNNTNFCNPSDIVEAFASYFQSVYTTDDESVQEGINNYSNINGSTFPSINIHHITPLDVEKALTELKPKMSSGLDQVPCFVAKDCKSVFTTPLTYIFNLSLRTCTFPNEWKLAKISPVLKSGDSMYINNYRPIALISVFSKVFELVIHNKLFPFLKCIITSNQHGFFPGRSTLTNLSCFTQYVASQLDTRRQVDCIYLDISKAFDRILHSKLLFKLSSYGFSENMIKFIETYLLNRQQVVCYNGFNSKFFHQSSGVPQGSVLGPLLFLLYVNDLTSPICNKTLLFADDLKIFRTINSVNDCLELQKDLETIANGCNANGLELNTLKCKVVSYSRKKSEILYNYIISGKIIERTDTVKDLGVQFDKRLTFSDHLDTIIQTSFKILGFIVRTCVCFNNNNTIKILYTALIRSKLEYCSIIWSTSYVTQSIRLESIQRRLLKYLYKGEFGRFPHRGFDQNELLTHFNLSKLENRRKISAVRIMFKLLHGKIDCPELLSQVSFYVPRIHSRQNNMFLCPKAKTNVLINSPMYKMMKLGNELVEICDLNMCSFNKLTECAKIIFK